LARVKTQFGKSIKALHYDKGGEYISTKFKEFYKDHGVMQKFTQTNSPHQNIVTKRWNQTLIEQARNLAFGANIPACLWVETVSTANYLINLLL
jgi:transposase InsO family protein